MRCDGCQKSCKHPGMKFRETKLCPKCRGVPQAQNHKRSSSRYSNKHTSRFQE